MCAEGWERGGGGLRQPGAVTHAHTHTHARTRMQADMWRQEHLHLRHRRCSCVLLLVSAGCVGGGRAGLEGGIGGHFGGDAARGAALSLRWRRGVTWVWRTSTGMGRGAGVGCGRGVVDARCPRLSRWAFFYRHCFFPMDFFVLQTNFASKNNPTMKRNSTMTSVFFKPVPFSSGLGPSGALMRAQTPVSGRTRGMGMRAMGGALPQPPSLPS